MMMETNDIQVWLTHRWNEEIFSVVGHWETEDAYSFIWQEGRRSKMTSADHVFLTAEAAIADAERRRDAVLSDLRARLADLEGLDFSYALKSVPVWQTMARKAGWTPPGD